MCIEHPTMLSSCRQKFLIFFSFCIFSNTAPTFYCQDWNTKQIFTLFWISCSIDVHERTSLKIFLSLSTGCLTLVWMFINGSGRTEKSWCCWNFPWIFSLNYPLTGTTITLNFLRMSPKLVWTYPNLVENRGNTTAPLILIMII